MKIHPIVATGVFTAFLALQGWMLTELSRLKENVAVLTVEIHQLAGNGKIASK